MAASVRVLLFATAREAVGRRELRLPVNGEGETATAVLSRLAARYPRLTAVTRGCRLVVNGRFIESGAVVVRPGDEFAVHPPYSGG